MTSAFNILRADAHGPFVIVCDHATNYIPDELNHLGLPDRELKRHIAYDIGAALIAEILSERFDSPAVFSATSRLVIDCNRQLSAFDLIPEVSDGTAIPGNRELSGGAKQARLERYFNPYHDAIERVIRKRPGITFLSVHSMTDRMKGVFRPWPLSLASHEDRTLVNPLLTILRSSNEYLVGDNEPYNLDPRVDYSTPQHAMSRGLPYLQVEFRQDEVRTEEGQKLWAGRFGDALKKAGF